MTINELVAKYEAGRDFYLTDRYNETEVRNEFLDPLFQLLGWDITNASAKPTHEREVLVEEPLKAGAGEHTKKPDYTFRLYAERKFFLEAKKPCVNIETDSAPARQCRRYGYTANLKISALSNFEWLYIYDTSIKVKESDDNTVAIIRRYNYTEYEEKFEELKEFLGRESVYSGHFDEVWKDIEVRLKQWSVDKQFLKQINDWRLMLGKEILANDTTIDMEALNDEVQSYINKILFLRVCEDRNIETYQELLRIADENHFSALIQKFKEADSRYNSGLFQPERSDQLIGNASSAFWTIIRQLYYPESPYSFSVFSSDILGHIYEIFIAQKLNIEDGELKIVNKPDNVDRDVVTTPTYIIREILRQTVTKSCQGKSAEDIFKMKFADIACGSGAFLLETYQLLNDLLIDYYLANDTTKLVQVGNSTYVLKFAEKKRLLTSCIFGVDKDFNAVEASKFGLLLKLLENEDADSLRSERPILPELSNNIYFGNSLLSSGDVKTEDVETINPFDFNDKFDVIIGNPPYLTTEGMKNITPKELPIYKKKYTSAYKQFDKYIIFIERAFSLLNEGGMLGYIVPSKFMKVGAGQELRKIITDNKCLESITSFGACQVFSDKSNYTCILILKNEEHETFQYNEEKNLTTWQLADKDCIPVDHKDSNIIGSETWPLIPDEQNDLFEKIVNQSNSLKEIIGEDNIFNGIQTSANTTYIFQPTSEDKEFYTFVNGGHEWKIEKKVTKPYFQTSRGDGLSTYKTFKPNARVIFPYKKKHNGHLDLIPIDDIQRIYPKLFAYLLTHKDVLLKRDIRPVPTTQDEWYRYGRHQNLESCNLYKKIIVGVLSTGDKYAIDTYGTFISSGGTAGYCVVALSEDSKYSIYYLQAILNCKYVEWFSSLYGEIFRGGFIARGTKVLNQLPIRVIDFDNEEDKAKHDDIANRQKELIELGDKIVANANNRRKLTTIKRQFDAMKADQDKAIRLLYNMSELEDSRIPIIKEVYAAD
jgi:hypothetical protein